MSSEFNTTDNCSSWVEKNSLDSECKTLVELLTLIGVLKFLNEFIPNQLEDAGLRT